ncbi:hypothetical protein H7K49_21960 [Paenibacillus typhae]|nr:hypothetical protein [Paenibacillus typhae]
MASITWDLMMIKSKRIKFEWELNGDKIVAGRKMGIEWRYNGRRQINGD